MDGIYDVAHFVRPEKPPRWDADLKAAEQTKKGKTLASAGRCEEAVPLFAEAYRTQGKSRQLRGAIDCAKSEGRWVHALALMELMIANHPEKVPGVQAQRAEELADIAAHTATLVIVLETPDAKLELDGAPVDPASMRLLPGRHVVHGTKEGFEPFEQEFELDAGSEQTVSVRLTETAPPPAATSDLGEVLDFCRLAPAESTGSYVRQRLVMFDVGGEAVTNQPESEVNERGELIPGVEHHVFEAAHVHEHFREVFGTTFPMERFYTVKARVSAPTTLARRPSISHAEMIRASAVDPFAAYSIACSDWVIAPRVVRKEARWTKVKKKKVVEGREVEYQAWDVSVV
ncbi:MAG TPA: hypothetical protein PLU22_01870 [Polyangiaceae bacterium]|nr:hypothetical protein [Polyangiaceae bacterium]